MATSNLLDSAILNLLNEGAQKLEEHFEADVLTYVGPIHEAILNEFRDFIEHLASGERERLALVIKTPGGSAQVAEKMVEIMRHHYSEVYFVVPDYSMSAGTLLAMSGDRIYMDYSSSLGPIDPQVPIQTPSGAQYVPALGYLDKVEELIQKSKANTITMAEFAILRDQNLAMLRSYEQARDLSISLLKEWLIKYKFQTWTHHATNPEKKGKPVTREEKEERASNIAAMLCDNKTWHAHGRLIGVATLRDALRLEINDYSADTNLRSLIRSYHDTLNEYVIRMNQPFCLHSTKRTTL